MYRVPGPNEPQTQTQSPDTHTQMNTWRTHDWGHYTFIPAAKHLKYFISTTSGSHSCFPLSHVRSTGHLNSKLCPPTHPTLSSPSSWSHQVLLETWPSSVVSVAGVVCFQGAETRRWYKYSEPVLYIGPSVLYHEPEDYKGKSYTSTTRNTSLSAIENLACLVVPLSMLIRFPA